MKRSAISEAAAVLGRKGGQSRSEAKRKANQKTAIIREFKRRQKKEAEAKLSA